MPHLSENHSGWNHWYHLVATAYGQWLRGDPRGWRERHHRRHVSGDYKNPPPPTPWQQAVHAQSQRLLKHDPYFFGIDDRPFVGEILRGTFDFQKVIPEVISVGGEHVHALVQCPNDDPEMLLGRSKQFVWMKFHEGQPRPWPKVWAKRPYGKPVRDEVHFRAVVGYIEEHVSEGAWVWRRGLQE